MKKALIVALLLALGAALGGTVLRAPLATAAGTFQSILVANNRTNPVPVVEQNLDANGNIKVAVGSTPITSGGGEIDFGCGAGEPFPLAGSRTATVLDIDMSTEVTDVTFYRDAQVVSKFAGPGFGGLRNIDLALARPVQFDAIGCHGGGSAGVRISWTGNEP